MVTITSEMKVAGGEDYVVTINDGDYADGDLILCASVDAPSVPIAMYQAQYVKYGPIVYQFNTPEDLGKAVYAVDPDSTLDAVALYKEQVARDAARAAGTLEPSDPVPATDSPTDAAQDDSQEADTEFFKKQAEDEAASSTPATSTDSLPDDTTPDVPDGDVLGTATSTPETVPDVPTDASSTPPVDVPAPDPGGMSTTTPDVLPDASSSPAVDLSTTTPE